MLHLQCIFHGIRFKVNKIDCRETINFFLKLSKVRPQRWMHFCFFTPFHHCIRHHLKTPEISFTSIFIGIFQDKFYICT